MHYLYLKWICWILAIPVFIELKDLSDIVAWSFSCGLTYLGIRFGQLYAEFRQRRRELEAEALLWKIQGHETAQGFFPDFTPEEMDTIRRIEMRGRRSTIFYLRPFAIDNKVVVRAQKSLAQYVLPGAAWLAPSEESLEQLLVEATPTGIDLIGIGNRVELLGPAKLLPNDANWKDVFLRHLPDVKAIVSIPSLHPSTLWELEQIVASGRRVRTLMIFTALHFDSRASPHFHLPAIRETLTRLGWHFPQNLASGNLVLFNEDGSIAQVFKSPHLQSRPLRRALRAAIQSAG